jgi:high-affinity Fe2+/Pb2+ permease
MTDLVKALVGTGKAATDLVAAVLILIGGLLIMGALVFRVFIHPEWAFNEALSALWAFLALGFFSVALGWLVDRVETSAASGRNRRGASRSGPRGAPRSAPLGAPRSAMSPQDTHPIR